MDPYLALISWAAQSTDCVESTSSFRRSTLAWLWERSKAERAASARSMFLQARHSLRPPSSDSSLSHSARPMPLQTQMRHQQQQVNTHCSLLVRAGRLRCSAVNRTGSVEVFRQVMLALAHLLAPVTMTTFSMSARRGVERPD